MTRREQDVLIIGAGFAGMYMLHAVRQLGLSATVIERGSGVGGTWFWNRYPGLRCDVESINYSYSFDEDIQQDWVWRERYSKRDDILDYANFVADRLDLRKDIRFDTGVVHASYDDATGQWQVELDDGSTLHAKYVVMAVGSISTPKIPDIPGIDDFAGEKYHTTAWPSEDPDFSGKRVGVIGTGSSGIQVIPIIAEQAAHLTVFQRTPGYSFPAKNAPISDETMRFVKENYPEHRRIGRKYGGSYVANQRPASEISPLERRVILERVYERSIPFEFLTIFADLMRNEDANREASAFIAEKIRERVKDPELAEQLIPQNDFIGARRICVDTNYYETYNRDNVQLVNLRKTPIVRMTGAGVQTEAEEIPLDAIIFATGYDAITGSILGIDIRGRGGISLAEKWADGPRLLLGLMSAGFPNMFFLTGPLSPSVLSNVLNSIEHHVEWVADCLAHVEKAGAERIEPREDAEDAWVDRINNVAAQTLFTKVDSWYMGSNIAGKPRVFPLFVEGPVAYRTLCREAAEAGYPEFTIS